MRIFDLCDMSCMRARIDDTLHGSLCCVNDGVGQRVA
jgi:hypothetical protein